MEPGLYRWEHQGTDHVVAEIHYRSGSLELQVLVGDAQHPHEMKRLQLQIGLSPLQVRIYDLLGTGRKSGLQKQGYGTFMGNLAVQFIKAVEPAEKRVYGLIYEPHDQELPEPEREAAQEGRRRFWARFGLNTSEKNAQGDDIAQGTVGTIHTHDGVTVGGQFPALIPLSAFSYAPLSTG